MPRILALLVFLAAAGALAAAEPAPKGDKAATKLELVSGPELTVRPQTAGAALEFRVPVRCDPPEQFARLSFAPAALFLKGSPLDTSAVTVRGEEEGVVKRLVVAIDTTKLDRPGAYTLKVQPVPADPKAPLPAVLEFTLNRGAAELTIPAPIRLHRTVYLPWVGRTEPVAVVVGEKSGRSFAQFTETGRDCQLFRPNGVPAGRLRFHFPNDRLGAGGEVTAVVETVESVDLGKTSGTVVVRSPQSASEEGQSITVEVTTRVWSVWLLVVIAVGIVAGYFGRTRLEEQRTRRAAAIAAHEQLDALDQFKKQTADLDLHAAVTSTRVALARAVGGPVDQVAKATAAAKTEFEAAVTAAETERNTARLLAKTLRDACGKPTDQPPPVAEFLKDVLLRLRQAEAKLTAGSRLDGHREIKELGDELKSDLPSRVSAWVAGYDAALARLAGTRWPETAMPVTATAIRTDTDELRKAAENATRLTLTARLRLRFRDDLLQTALSTVFQTAADVRARLADAPLNLKDTIPKLDAALAAARAEQPKATAENLAPIAERVHDLTAAVRSAVTAAAREAGVQSPELTAELDAGKYLAAANRVVPPSGSKLESLGAGTAPAAPAFAPTDSSTPVKWELSIEVPPPVVANCEAKFFPRLRTEDGRPAPAVTVEWEVDGKTFATTNGNPLSYTPTAGSLRVVAVAKAADGTQQRSELTVRATEPDGAAALDGLRAEQRRAERIQTAIYGALVAVTGYALFGGDFTGTFAEFLGVFFWGFTADIGLAKVRELNATIAPRIPASAATGT